MNFSMLTPGARVAMESPMGWTLPRLYATVAIAMALTDGDGYFIESRIPAWPDLD